jgi:hypothetical protein
MAEDIRQFIDEHEPEYCSAMLGEALYAELLAGLESSGPLACWTALRDKIITGLVNYVYFRHQDSIITATAGTGESEIQAENSDRMAVIPKMSKAWNRMVDNNKAFVCWMANENKVCPGHDAVYPSYRPDCRLQEHLDLFHRTNPFGI